MITIKKPVEPPFDWLAGIVPHIGSPEKWATQERRCDVHGAYQSTKVPLSTPVWTTCPWCREDKIRQESIEQQDRRMQALAQLDARRARDIMDMGGIPPRYLDSTFDVFAVSDDRQNIAVAAAQDYAQALLGGSSANLIIVGGFHVGKTHLACSIASRCAFAGLSVSYSTAMRMVQSIRSARSYRDQGDAKNSDHFASASLLILDDVGVGYNTASEMVELLDVLDMRYQNRLATVLVSNLDENALIQYLGPRIVAKMSEDGLRAIVCAWAAYEGGAR